MIVLPSVLVATADRPPRFRVPEVGIHPKAPPLKNVPTTAKAFAPTSAGSTSGGNSMKKTLSSAEAAIDASPTRREVAIPVFSTSAI